MDHIFWLLPQAIFKSTERKIPFWLVSTQTSTSCAYILWKGYILKLTHDFRTIHGRSRYPGLHIWARNTGKRIAVKVPAGRYLLVQAGKQLEHLTGGLIKAGLHEVVVNDATIQVITSSLNWRLALILRWSGRGTGQESGHSTTHSHFKHLFLALVFGLRFRADTIFTRSSFRAENGNRWQRSASSVWKDESRHPSIKVSTRSVNYEIMCLPRGQPWQWTKAYCVDGLN